MRLCGSDMDDQTTVLEAGLGWIVGWKKDDFLGAERPARAEGRRPRAQAGAVRDASDRAIARHGYPVVRDGQPVGVVTSGTQTPFLKKADRLRHGAGRHDRRSARRSTSRSAAGASAAEVVPEPFYKRPGEAPERRRQADGDDACIRPI